MKQSIISLTKRIVHYFPYLRGLLLNILERVPKLRAYLFPNPGITLSPYVENLSSRAACIRESMKTRISQGASNAHRP